MSRPKSMTDFSNLLSASAQQSNIEKRKKPSISLAAGLIMNSESPKSIPNTPSQAQTNGTCSDNLFYAYGRRSDYAQFPPYLLTFSSASVATQWWDLVKTEYPDSTREGTQLFTFKGEDVPSQIWDNGKFTHLKNKWFYSHLGDTGGSAGIIPIQDERGNLISARPSMPITQPSRDGDAARPSSNSSAISPTSAPSLDLTSLNATLDRMNAMIAENTSQIHALSVAQSEGLQRMQEINESNALQIKSLADGQAKLQSLVDANASHFIALSNSQFQNQEQVKGVLDRNASQIESLADGQSQLASVCKDMMKAITQLSQSVSASQSNGTPHGILGGGRALFETMGPRGTNFISSLSPAPRKLNRKIKGVWYEYDPSPLSSPRTSVSMDTNPTPPRSPVVRHVKFENGC